MSRRRDWRRRSPALLPPEPRLLTQRATHESLTHVLCRQQPSTSDRLVMLSDDDDAPDQVSFAQSREDALKNKQDQPVVQQGKKRKRSRRGDRKIVAEHDVREKQTDDSSSGAKEDTGSSVEKEEVVQISLPQRTVIVKSGTGTTWSGAECDFKERLLSHRKRVTRISTSRSAAYRAEKQAYR